MSVPKDGIRGREPREQGQEQKAGEHTSSILLLSTVSINHKGTKAQIFIFIFVPLCLCG